jgi:hypothetical protein
MGSAPRRSALLLVAALAAGCAGGGDTPTTGYGPPADSVSAPEPPPRTVVPRAGMANVRPHPFESATPIGDETRLEVRFWGGVEPCFVLDRVEVREDAAAVTVTLYAGSDPARPDAMCIEIAVSMAVVVRLDAPLGARAIRDGAAPDPAS